MSVLMRDQGDIMSVREEGWGLSRVLGRSSPGQWAEALALAYRGRSRNSRELEGMLLLIFNKKKPC